MNSIKLAAVVALCVAGQSLAANDSQVSYTLQLGGDNHVALWENPPDCNTGINPLFTFTAGSTADGQTYAPGAIITWAAEVAVSGTYGPSGLVGGASNLVFDLDLRHADGVCTANVCTNSGATNGSACTSNSDCNNLVTEMVHGSPTSAGWFSTINDGDADGTRYTTCSGQVGVGPDPLEDAAFAVRFQIDTSDGHKARMNDPSGANGPNLDFFQYPATNGYPANGTCTGAGNTQCVGGPRNGLACTSDPQCEGSHAPAGTLKGVGAGYSKFFGSGCQGFGCNTASGTNEAGVGLSAPATGNCGLALGNGPVVEGQMNTSGLASGTYVLKLIPGAGNNIVDGSLDCGGELGKFALKPDLAAGPDTITFIINPPPVECARTIADANRRLFYNSSFYDSAASACSTLTGVNPCNDNTAIATDKSALNPAGVATTANYISFNKSINGLMIDVLATNCTALPAGPLPASNFEFKIANSANINSYVLAAAPTSLTVTLGGGTGGADRIVIIWANNAIPNTRWLRTLVKSAANGGLAGLASDNVFYYGVAIGESLTPSATRAIVNSTDEIDARSHPHNSLPANRVPVSTNSTYNPGNAADSKYDFDKSSTVSSTDEIIARSNPTNSISGLLLLNPAP